MSDIIYRKATQQDFAIIAGIFATNMDLSVFTTVKDTGALYHFACLFIANDFMRSSFVEVAEHDGKLCGVVMGSTTMTHDKAVVFDHKALSTKAKAALQQTKNGQQVLRDLNTFKTSFDHTRDSDADSELLFFFVDKHYRRNNIGSKLIRSFEYHLTKLNANGYSLHTDTRCSYQYYENNGYQRVSTHNNIFNPEIEHYTYIKSINKR